MDEFNVIPFKNISYVNTYASEVLMDFLMQFYWIWKVFKKFVKFRVGNQLCPTTKKEFELFQVIKDMEAI